MTTDVLHAWRSLRAMPLVSVVVIVSLAIGIGANTVVFSWLQMVKWKPLPGVAAASTLQLIEPRTDNGVYVGTSWPDYRDLQQRLRSFQWLIAFRMTPLTMGDASRVERATGLFVSGNYFCVTQSPSCRGPAARPRRCDCARRPARRRDLVRLLADAIRRRRVGDRIADSHQRRVAQRGRRGAATVSGDDARSRVRHVAAGDAWAAW